MACTCEAVLIVFDKDATAMFLLSDVPLTGPAQRAGEPGRRLGCQSPGGRETSKMLVIH